MLARLFRSFAPMSIVLALLLAMVGVIPAQAQSEVGIGLVIANLNPAPSSFDGMALSGLLRAESELGGLHAVVYPASDYGGDYASAFQACAADGMQLCLNSDFLNAEVMVQKAWENPSTSFAVMSSVPDENPPPNLRGVTMDYQQAGFLAGVLAALKSTNRKVAVVGGMDIPVIYDLVRGYRSGAGCANRLVQVTSRYAGAFDQPELGAQIAAELLDAGNDVVYNAAGATGGGAILFAAQNGAKAIGVDTDEYYTLFGAGSVPGAANLLSSTVQRIDRMVFYTIQDFLAGQFGPGTVVYGAAEGVVELAPFHEASVSDTLRQQLDRWVVNLKTGRVSAAQGCFPGVGLLTESNETDSHSYYGMIRAGLMRAVSAYSITGAVYVSPDPDTIGVDMDVNRCYAEGNELCIGAGFYFGNPLFYAAQEHPDIQYAVIDWHAEFDPNPPNLRLAKFAHQEVAYLAGALAAKMTDSAVVGDIGGIDIPPVLEFMDGYKIGAQCTRSSVTVLEAFAGTFNDPDLGAALAAEMMTAGADVIYAPAGPTGSGAIRSAAMAGAWVIGVDTDEYFTTFGGGRLPGAKKILTSTMKNLNFSVYDTVGDFIRGRLTGGIKLYNLANGGVSLAPYHQATVPRSVKLFINTLKRSIIRGVVDVNQPCP